VVLSPSYSYPGVSEEPSRGGTVFLLCLFVFLCESQSIFCDFLAIGGTSPDLVLAAVVACGIFRGREQGFWLGLSGGLVQDLAGASGSPMGQLALAKMVVGWLVGGMATSVRRTFVVVPIVLIALATVFNLVVAAFFTANLAGLQWRLLTSSALVNVVYGLPVYYCIGCLPGSIRS